MSTYLLPKSCVEVEEDAAAGVQEVQSEGGDGALRHLLKINVFNRSYADYDDDVDKPEPRGR